MIKRRWIQATVMSIVALAVGQTLHAGTTWDGGGGAASAWTNGANWGGSTPLFDGTELLLIDVVNAAGQVSSLDGDKSAARLTFDTGSDPFTINDDTLTLTNGELYRLGAATAAHTINSNLVLDAVGNWINGANLPPGGTDLTVNGDISGAGGIYSLGGSGRTILNGDNSYTGGTTVDGGHLAITGNNTTPGDTILKAGRIFLGHDNALGTGKLIFEGTNLTTFGSFANSPVTIANDIAFQSSTTFTNVNLNATGGNIGGSSPNLIFTGNIDPITTTLNLNTGGFNYRTEFQSDISGSAGINFGGSQGTYVLSGDLSYTGDSQFNIGTGNNGVVYSGNNNIPGRHTVGATNIGAILNVGSDTAFQNGTLVLRGFLLTDNGSPRQIGSNLELDIAHPLGFFFNGGFTFNGPTVMKSNSTLISQTNTTNLNFVGDISDEGNNYAFTLNPYGQVNATYRFSGNNSFSGGVVMPNHGILEIASDTALGTGDLTLGNTATGTGASQTRVRAIGGAYSLPNNVIFDDSNLNATNYGFSGDLTFNGTFALSDVFGGDTDRLLYVNTGGNLHLAGGVIEGVNGSNLTLTKQGNGSLILGAGGSYTQNTIVSDGRLVAAGNSAMGTIAGSTTVASGASLGFQGNVNYTTAEPVTVNGLGDGNLGVILNIAGDNRFAGPITIVSAGGTNFGAIAGTLTLAGNITGPTHTITKVGAGTLALDGNTMDVVALSVTVGALGGTGTIDGNLTFSGGTAFEFNLLAEPMGFSYNTITVTGDVNLGNAYLDITHTASVQPWQILPIVINDGVNPVNGTFLTLGQGQLITLSTGSYARISYFGDVSGNSAFGGNDVVLYDFLTVPEPAAGMLVLLGGALLAGRVSRRRG